MSIRLLLFKGEYENEGVFYAIETDENILIFAAGGDRYLQEPLAQQIGRDYLVEKKKKIVGIIVTNTLPLNVDLIEKLCYELGTNIPIYGSYHSKLILHLRHPRLRNKIYVVKEEEREMGKLSISFTPCDSYVIGNLAVACHYVDYSFFFCNDFYFSFITNNKLLTSQDIFTRLEKFFNQKRANAYLVTNIQGISWHNNNSLILNKNNLIPGTFEIGFYILNCFDWMHTIELVELLHKWEKNVVFLNSENTENVKKVLFTDGHLRRINHNKIGEENENNNAYILLVDQKDSITDIIDLFLKKKIDPEMWKRIRFFLGLHPMIGKEKKIASLTDYLCTVSGKITDLSRDNCFRLGISFADLQLITKILNPLGIIVINNSYRSKNILSHITTKQIFINNNHYFETTNKKFIPFSNKKNIINIDEMLLEQKRQLQESGLLVLCLTIGSSEKEKFYLQKIHIEKISISFITENTEKLENKIKKWWETKLSPDLDSLDTEVKTIRSMIEKRVSALIRKFINYEYNKEVVTIPIISFTKEIRN